MYRRVITVYISFTMLCGVVECGCVFQGINYEVGEIWHPETFGTCVNCTCEINKRGEPDVRCINTAENCPKVTCDTPIKDPHTCCPYCEVSADEDERSSHMRANCTTPSGRIYKDGERYASNSTGLRPTSENQCVMCTCQDGQPLCHLKTCHLPKACSKFIQREGDCCPVCADLSVVSWDDPAFYETVRAIEAIKAEHDCLETSGIKLNGSQWHPSIDSIGEIECITCTCLNGDIKCQKDCLPDHKLPCRHPKKPKGECCRACPEEQKNTKPSKDKKRHKKRRKGKGKGKGRKRCKSDADKKKKRCRRKRRKERTTLQSVKPTATVGIALENLCIKRKTAYLVYKSLSATEMFIAFDDISANTVVVYTWKVNKEHPTGEVVTYIQDTELPSAEFRQKINNTNVVGTATKSQYKKFKRRLKDKLEKCTVDCEPELFLKIMQRVKVILLKFGDAC
ncbi:hypothetical protein ACF0H5_020826 [Mactra antiquata]